MIKKITFEEAVKRINSGKIVFTVIGGEYDEEMLSYSYLQGYEGSNVEFGYDEYAESKAESILCDCSNEVKKYIYRLLLADGDLC
jgi:hypothetical protein